MAGSNSAAVTITAIVAILVIVGLAIYFVREETDEGVEIDLGQLSMQVESAPSVVPPAGLRWSLGKQPYAS